MIDNLVALGARDDLLAIVTAWPALQARLVPSGSSTGGSRPAPSSRPPIDIAVSDLIHEITTQTEFYARVLMDETDDWEPPTSTMPGLLEAVARRYGHFTHGDDDMLGLDFCDTAHEMRRRVAAVIERPAPPRWLGPCVVDECEGELRLHEGRMSARCPVCGRVVDLAEIHEHLMAAMSTRLMTRSELVSALVILGLDVRPKTLDKWVERRRLEPAMIDPTLYRFEDALTLAERRKVA